MLKKLIKKLLNIFSKGINFLDVQDIVCYICGNEALPNPLDSEEEKILLEEMNKGNENAKVRLVEHNLRLVVYIAKKFESTGLDLEDLISIGAIGLIKAVQTYKFDKNIKFYNKFQEFSIGFNLGRFFCLGYSIGEGLIFSIIILLRSP